MSEQVTKVLMVCLGNICRSPLAQGILEFKAKENNLNLFVDSAGTGAWHEGNAPDIRSQRVALKHNINISNQKARIFSSNDFDVFDKIYVMDTSNLSDVLYLARDEKDKAKVDLLLNAIEKKNLSVPDPYYGGVNGFEEVFQLINKACEFIINQYKH